MKKRMKKKRKRLIEFARNDTAAARHAGTGGWSHTTAHRLAILIEPPFGVGARDEAALGVPASDPVQAIVEKEEAELLGATALVQRGLEPAATLFEFRLEHVAMKDAAVDQGGGNLFVVLGSIAADEMPSTTREEVVGARDGRLPVLFAVDGAVNAVPVLEPVLGAAQGAHAEEEVGGHDMRNGLIRIIGGKTRERITETRARIGSRAVENA